MSTVAGSFTLEELAGDYVIDTGHSEIGFEARHAMVTKVRGTFDDFEGRGHFDPNDLSATWLEVVIRTDSVNTRNTDRDQHLRSPDFFDTANHPEMRFRSTEITKVDDQHWKVTGDLTIRGVTKPVTFDVEWTGAVVDPWGNVRVGLEGHAEVNRRDWGLEWNMPLDKGGLLVSEKVKLNFDVAAIRQGESRQSG
ncbi:MAG: polyisoprenoid-binding protein [Acidimicrobiales bacterium]|nr:MAG: polyisoprenoid-binding protein [Acidimicrobiales bacterium]